MAALFAMLAAGVYLIFASTPYRPPAAPVALCLLIVLLLSLLARKLRKQLGLNVLRVDGAAPASRPATFFLLGFLFSVTLLLLANFLAASKLPAVTTILITGAVYLVIGLRIVKMSGNGLVWDESQKLALAAGLMSVFVVFGFVMEFAAGSRGMVAVGTCAVILFLWVRRRIREDRVQKAIDAV